MTRRVAVDRTEKETRMTTNPNDLLGGVSPLRDPDNRFHAATIDEVNAALDAEGYSTGLNVWANIQRAYIEYYLNGDSDLAYAQFASFEAALRAAWAVTA